MAAKLLAMQARGYAALRQDEACGQRLRQAERILVNAPEEPPSPWVSHFDGASLAAEVARCELAAFRLVEAREASTLLRPYVRQRVEAGSHAIATSAVTYLHDGQPVNR